MWTAAPGALLGFLSLVVISTPPGGAQPATGEHVRVWLDSEIKRATASSPPHAEIWSWEVDKPNADVQSGARRIRYSALMDGVNWRLNTDPDGQGFIDIACTGNVAWCLTPVSLTLVKPGNIPKGIEGVDYCKASSEFHRHLSYFSTGGGVIPAILQASISSALVTEDGRWTAEAVNPDRGLTLTLSGTWSTTSSAPFIERVEVAALTSSPSEVHRTWVFSRPTGLFGALERTASGVIEYDPDGSINEAITLTSIAPADRDTVDSWLKTPTSTSIDAVRGPSTVKGVRDLRDGIGAVSVNTLAGSRTVPDPQSTGNSKWASVRYVGWGVLAALIALLVIARRAKSSGAH